MGTKGYPTNVLVPFTSRKSLATFEMWPPPFKSYDIFYTNNPPIPRNYLREMLRLILQEKSFQYIGKDYLHSRHRNGNKKGISLANMFMAKIETEIINHCTNKPLVWKRYKRPDITLQSNLQLKVLTKKLLF